MKRSDRNGEILGFIIVVLIVVGAIVFSCEPPK